MAFKWPDHASNPSQLVCPYLYLARPFLVIFSTFILKEGFGEEEMDKRRGKKAMERRLSETGGGAPAQKWSRGHQTLPTSELPSCTTRHARTHAPTTHARATPRTHARPPHARTCTPTTHARPHARARAPPPPPPPAHAFVLLLI